MTKKFKPMLAVELEKQDKLPLPIYTSPKLDGYRCLCLDGKAVSRNLKPIRNKYVRSVLEEHMHILDGFDGELCLSNLTAPFNEVSSAMSSFEGVPEFRYVVFDNHKNEGGYKERFLDAVVSMEFPEFVKVIPNKLVASLDELLKTHEIFTAKQFEGTMIRRADGQDEYKFGRSTERQAFLLKFKDFKDSEGIVVDVVERMHNENEATIDELGHTKRSSHKANKTPAGTLGAFVVKSKDFEDEFEIGTGMDDAFRKQVWDNQEAFIGKQVKFKYQPFGTKDRPRFPVFLGMRGEDDL